MSSIARDMVEGYEDIVNKIDHFTASNCFSEPSTKALLELVEKIREDCVANYNAGSDDLGWNVTLV